MRKLLENIESDLRFLVKKITDYGYNCGHISVDLWLTDSIRILMWDDNEHLQCKDSISNSAEDLLNWLQRKEILFRKFN